MTNPITNTSPIPREGVTEAFNDNTDDTIYALVKQTLEAQVTTSTRPINATQLPILQTLSSLDPQIQCQFGTRYLLGLGVPKDLERAKICFEQAANQGNVEARLYLAVCYMGGKDGYPINKHQALAYFEQAADQGNAEAQYIFGACHLSEEIIKHLSLDCTPDVEIAMEYLNKACDQNHKKAMKTCISIYLCGNFGIPQNLQKCADLIQKYETLFGNVLNVLEFSTIRNNLST